MSLDSAFESPQAKRQYVRKLFATIADRYDLITAVLSYGQDARWKKTLVSIADIRPGERALDLAAGTGDIAFAVAARGAKTIGLDITHRMLQLARLRSSGASARQALKDSHVEFITGDMTSLPFRSGAFDLVTTGYGLRNVPDLNTAIDEIARVLKPGGRLLSLDFNRPENAIVRAVYLAYLTVVGSTLGWILHRDPDTYRYIPASIRRYPGARGVADRIAARGFDHVTVIPLLFGLMSLHLADLPTEAPRAKVERSR
ncbi:MAG: ubiquinone/menaquinone biosynthesis methyltransferase [Cyanobacteria bacterium]|nr:ubiquinone/menaquinone biosynthesis methyltransferase [Cyanobacteriota bacterium]